MHEGLGGVAVCLVVVGGGQNIQGLFWVFLLYRVIVLGGAHRHS